jgi:zinc/manganese transport system ATP-binding protein
MGALLRGSLSYCSYLPVNKLGCYHMTECALHLVGLTHKFGTFTALKEVDLSFQKGSLTAIIGPNGGGKSTLVKCVTGLYKPASGKIHFIGVNKDDLSYMPQKSELDLSFPVTVQEVVAMGLLTSPRINRKISQEEIEKIDSVLEEMGLYNQKNQLVETLSGGQFQRLLFARLILQDKSLIILDEPFSHIDEKTRDMLLKTIQGWHKKGKTILIILHEIHLVRKFFPQCVLLSRETIASGLTETVLSKDNIAEAFEKILEAE